MKFAFSILIVFFAVLTVHAQVDRASFNGTVHDSSGRVVAHARIVAVQLSTGMQRVAESSAEGSYDMPNLPVGVYSVSFIGEGFEQVSLENVVARAGLVTTLDAHLRPAGVVEHLEVSGQTTQLNEASDSLGARMERKQVQELPLNGRNWATLTALVPGAVDTGGSNQRTIRFAGRGLDDNNFTYDGIDATNIVNQAQQPFVRLAIPTDTIQEFHIESMLFTAESGSTPGGQVAVVSGAGTNQVHGSFFEFLRNDVFDAREPIDLLNPHKPAFRLNQFGGSLGGPLRKNKTFYFLAYEGLRQTWGQTLPGFVPTDAFKAQVKAQSPELAPILDAYPEGQIIVSPTQAEFAGAGKQIDQEDSGMLRVDHVFSEKSTAYLRFNFDAAVNNVPLASGGNAYLLDKQETTSRPVNGTIEFLHLFSPELVNEAKFGFNRGTVFTSNQAATNLPYSVAVSGFSTLNNNEFKVGVGNSFSYIDNLTWVRGKHTAKFGVEVRRIQLNQGNTANGSITFASAAQFQANQVSSASYAAALPVNGLRKTSVFAFAQDEWKLRPNFTLNAGVRYSFFNRFREVLGRAVPFDFATCGPQGFCPPGAEFSVPRVLDIDPRISVAWSPHVLAGKTVVRAGFGIYHGDGQEDDQNLPISNEVARYSLSSATTPALSFPIEPFLAVTQGIVSPREMDRNRKDMYVNQWGASIQQAMPGQFVGTLSYVGSEGEHIITTSYFNLIDPATGLRPHAGFGQIESRGNENNSSFQALVASLQRSFAHGVLAGANYMWSHAIDNGSAGGGDAEFPGIPGCPRCERSSSDFDVRSVFNANLVYELPFKRGEHGLLAAAFGNWQLMGIATARSGLPVNVTVDRSSSSVATGYTTNQRPDRVPFVPLTPPGGSSIGHWINPAAFTAPQTPAYGTAGRNLVRAPNLWQMDTGLAKHIPFGDNLQLELRGEVFNVFNRAQYGSPLADISSNTFGQIINTVNVGPVGTGTPRQVQFAARFQF